MEIQQLHQLFLTSNGICTDNRVVKENEIFFALRGENFNGNTFAKKALENGALQVIIDDKNVTSELDSTHYILVDDVLKTLQELARYHRNYLNIPIIGLTGSNGKTTTKELIYAVISQSYKTIATIGNLNNHIGVPLTLLRMTEETEIGIVEMGANHQKEIEFLCTIAQPNLGYITNFGKAHLEGFGGVEGVIKGKSELYTYLKQNNQTVITNLDDSKQNELTINSKRFTFGQNNNPADVLVTLKNIQPFLEIEYDYLNIKSNLIGIYNFNNIASAICIGTYFKVPKKLIKKGIESYVPSNNRSQLIQIKTNKIILDAYNANPSSMEAVLHNLSKQNSSHNYLILGDMFELGDEAWKEHLFIINLVKSLQFKDALFVGGNFYKHKSNFKEFKFFKEYKDLEEYINLNLPEKRTILVKGSRGMALERILKIL
ncbi:UDP-N-acetylmuramoyl-tripeptide--D-alanyl-D-alanine ligase [Aurantibacter aestuarii]|uniref:UDP-N-acetylmuramoyl-tripeptide--D-alanyl-D-alanine ligase n=1 Tax=Aurantibacter aestuarii TaxID=1266046 RepID=A0A2T1N6W9_9FLAO|nr:UDP-N-acetylmuramoyl-tripeptide--D-alanyl-D-alanine ligase [Aurantibacter aestuarii]PSG87341.1 UDP-N-acetylmuramoyl-tripeptide--D-alanyl-D-alanine ligase [Aurantibacter aestuarii]